MSDDSDLIPDLFDGLRPAPADPRGRKAHEWSKEVAEIVAVLSAAGRTQAEIADLVNLSEKTLRKYYSPSLDRGHELAVGATLISAFQAVKAGKVSAMNLLLRRLEGDAPAAERASRPRTPRAEPLGKKAEADRAAQTAHEGTEWNDLLH